MNAADEIRHGIGQIILEAMRYLRRCTSCCVYATCIIGDSSPNAKNMTPTQVRHHALDETIALQKHR